MRCLSRKYDLSHLTGGNGGEHRCPECGRAFDPNDPHSYETPLSALRAKDRTVGIVVIALIIVVLGVVLTCWGSVILESIISHVLTADR